MAKTPHGQQFIAMEHIPGETLRARLGGQRRPLQEALDVALQIASALTAAHAAGIVHRDLKPENVMLRPDGLVKVVDFGIAKLAHAEASSGGATHSVVRTDTAIVAGTAAYMFARAGSRFERGCANGHLVAGRDAVRDGYRISPIAGETSSDVLAAILDREPPGLTHFDPAAPPELQASSARR